MNFSKQQRQLAFAAALVATTICSVGLVSSVVRALPAGTAPAGAIQIDPPNGDSSTTFGLSFPSAQACPGDGPAGYQWSTFISDAANDLATVTFNASGSPVAPTGFTTSLRDTTQTQVKAQFPGLGDGIVNPPSQVTFESSFFSAVPAGEYWIALSCYRADGGGINQTERYWATRVTIAASTGAGPNNFTYAPSSTSDTTTTSTTTTTTVAGTTTTTVAGTTTTTVAGATTTTVAGATQAATLSPAVPTPGGSYRVTHPNCRVGDTVTVTQAQSTPSSATATCAAAVAGIRRPAQAATTGVATVTFTAAPTAPGTYTVTSSGPQSGTRTATFVIVGQATPPVGSTGGSPSGTSTGTIPSTGSSTTSIVVWGLLLLAFGRMAILLGRKPKVIQAQR